MIAAPRSRSESVGAAHLHNVGVDCRIEHDPCACTIKSAANAQLMAERSRAIPASNRWYGSALRTKPQLSAKKGFEQTQRKKSVASLTSSQLATGRDVHEHRTVALDERVDNVGAILEHLVEHVAHATRKATPISEYEER